MSAPFRVGERVRFKLDFSKTYPKGTTATVVSCHGHLYELKIASLPSTPTIAEAYLERIPEEPMRVDEITPEWAARVARNAVEDFIGPSKNSKCEREMEGAIANAIMKAVAPKPRVFRVTFACRPGKTWLPTERDIVAALERFGPIDVTVEEITE